MGYCPTGKHLAHEAHPPTEGPPVAYPPAEEQIETRLGRLTLEQKVGLLTGADTWALKTEPAIGLGRMVLSDGPSGVRGELWDERDPSLNLPSATALAATWDPDVAYRYGAAMAAEAHRKGVHVVLGPTINLHRSPLGGRHFEAYSEDPELTSVIAEAFVRGLQDHGVGACPKHYVANDFETERFSASVAVSERALRELYLVPFERSVAAGAWTIMSAYNGVDGVTMTENDLLASPLCDEWGFDGVVISDWGAVRSVVPAGRARQDLAMPGPESPWADGLVEAVRAGEVPMAAIDEKVRRILRLAARVGLLEGVDAEAAAAPDVSGVALAREAAARGMVLVRNDGVLPLAAPTSVAVVGQSALVARTQGGGSATVVPESTVAPLDGLRAAWPDATITHALGAVVHSGIFPLEPSTITDPESGESGMRARFFAADGAVLLDEHRGGAELVWLGNAPREAARLELVADLRPERSGPVELGLQSVGHCILELDDEVLLDVRLATDTLDLGAALLFPPHRTTRVELTAGQVYRLRVVSRLAEDISRPPGLAALTVGSRPVDEAAEVLIDEAVRVAGADALAARGRGDRAHLVRRRAVRARPRRRAQRRGRARRAAAHHLARHRGRRAGAGRPADRRRAALRRGHPHRLPRVAAHRAGARLPVRVRPRLYHLAVRRRGGRRRRRRRRGRARRPDQHRRPFRSRGGPGLPDPPGVRCRAARAVARGVSGGGIQRRRLGDGGGHRPGARVPALGRGDRRVGPGAGRVHRGGRQARGRRGADCAGGAWLRHPCARGLTWERNPHTVRVSLPSPSGSWTVSVSRSADLDVSVYEGTGRATAVEPGQADPAVVTLPPAALGGGPHDGLEAGLLLRTVHLAPAGHLAIDGLLARPALVRQTQQADHLGLVRLGARDELDAGDLPVAREVGDAVAGVHLASVGSGRAGHVAQRSGPHPVRHTHRRAADDEQDDQRAADGEPEPPAAAARWSS